MAEVSRIPVLLAIHEQTQLSNGHLTAQPGGEPVQAWSREQWHSAFEHLFYHHSGHHHDDLLFLVDRPAPGRACTSFSVQRKASGSVLPPHLSISGPMWNRVAWAETVLLNLVVQATYELTVTSCRQDLLAQVAEGVDVSSQAVAVTKQVYASPSHTAVNLEAGKAEAEPQPAYPSIHFSVENYDDVFDNLVLQQDDDCFCVVLRAVLPHAATSDSPSTSSHMVLFSGYVVHKQIIEHLGAKLKPPLGMLTSLLSRLFAGRGPDPAPGKQQGPQRHAVYMRGPGGVGLAEVAVCSVPGDAGQAGQATDAVAGEAAEGEGVRVERADALQCALVSVSVPVDVLATNILEGHLRACQPAAPTGDDALS